MDDFKRLQFGTADPAKSYRDRPAAFGVALMGGNIACVRVEREGEASYFDLPGGALDPGEDAAAALVREFGEETGLKVRAGERFACAAQYMLKTDGEPVNNLCALFEAEIEGEDAVLKIEADHTLVWLDPTQALRDLRHDAHAWGVAAWMRRVRRPKNLR